MDLLLAIPTAWAGFMVSLVCFMYVLRWSALVYEMLRPIPSPKYCVQQTRRSFWLAPFVFLHPIPWLLLATPYIVYTLFSAPHASGWNWFFGGGFIGVTYLLAVAFVSWRNHVRQPSAANKS